MNEYVENITNKIWNSKNYGVHLNFLKNFAVYDNEDLSLYKEFDYSYNKQEIEKIYNMFSLKKLIKISEIDTIICATNWVNGIFKKLDGYLKDFEGKKTIDIMDEIINTRASGNCKVHSIVLRDVLLALGILNRSIICKPIDYYFIDCHVVNIVYSAECNKWLLFDSAQNLYYKNSEGVILSLQELREYIISNKRFTIERINSNDDFDRSYKSSKNKMEVSMFKTKVISYMAKNTFRFSSLQECFLQPDKKIKRIIEYNLIPKHYIQLPYNTSICLKNRQQFVEKFISNENLFWSLPNVNEYLLAKI